MQMAGEHVLQGKSLSFVLSIKVYSGSNHKLTEKDPYSRMCIN